VSKIAKRRARPVHLEPIRRDAPRVARNDPCPCGSGVKFKKCCGKPVRHEQPHIYGTFQDQYAEEQRTLEQAFIKQWGFKPNQAQLSLFSRGDNERLKSLIVQALEKLNADPALVHAANTLGMLLTPTNSRMHSAEVLQRWKSTMDAFNAKGKTG
jgi:hypothetical protein